MSMPLDAGPLHEVLAAFQDEDVDAVAPARVDAEVAELQRAGVLLEVVQLRRPVEWERQQLWAADGSKSAAAALARRCGIGIAAARQRLQLAARLREAPEVTARVVAGTLSMAKARLLVWLLSDDRSDRVKEAFRLALDDLLDVAERVSLRDLGYVINHFAAHADPEAHERKWKEQYDANRVNLAESFEGCGHLDGLLDPESTQIARHALGVMEDRVFREEHATTAGDGDDDRRRRTPAQRRAEAFLALCQSVLDDDPAHDGNLAGVARPVVSAVVDADLLDLYAEIGLLADGDLDGRGLDDGDRDADLDDERSAFSAWLAGSNVPLPRSVAQRLLCDAVFVRVITKGSSAPLDVGRGARDPSAAMLRALLVRDGGCAFPGCETPPRFCQAHHIHHWKHGGSTALTNLVLLCRHHHRLVHQGQWRCHVDDADGRPRFLRPDGRECPVDMPPLELARTGRRLARGAERRRTERPAA